MNLKELKHVELCPDCQEKVNQAYFTTIPAFKAPSYKISQRKKHSTYFVEYKDRAGKRKRISDKTRDEAIANQAAAEWSQTGLF